MVVAFVSPLKAFFATVFEDSLVEVILMVFNFLHPLKAFAPILVALLPNVTLVREEHPLNAFAPISVTFLPIFTVLSFVHL